MGESSQREILSYRLAAHVFRYLRQTFWQLTRSWQILLGRDDNKLLRRSPWGFDAVMQFPFFWGGGGGVGEWGSGGVGIKIKQDALWPMWKWWTHYFAAHSALQIISLFWGICQYGLGCFSIAKNIYFRYCGDDCCLHQRSTSTINTIILGLRRVVFYDGSNWLLTMRGEVGLQKESLQISDYQNLVSLRSLTRLFFC